jgi:hypothetical protein
MIACPVCCTAEVTPVMVSCSCRRLNAWAMGDGTAELEWGFAPYRKGRGSIGQSCDGSLFYMTGAVVRWIPEEERESVVGSTIAESREHDLSERVLLS